MNIEELISQYIDGSLSSEAEAELHHRLAVSPEARRLFRAHIMLRGVARDQRVLHTPAPEVRNKLFDRLVQEEGMKPAAAVPIHPALGAVQTPLPPAEPVTSVPSQSVPSQSGASPSGTSLRQDRPPERRRRRMLPWLIPSMIAAMLLVVLWSGDWGGPSGTTGSDLADGGTGNQKNTTVEKAEGSDQIASSDAVRPSTGGSDGGSVMTDQGAAPQAVEEPSARSSSAASGNVGNQVGNQAAGGPSSAVERAEKRMAPYDAPRRTSPAANARASRSREDFAGGIASGADGSLHDFSAETTIASVQSAESESARSESARSESVRSESAQSRNASTQDGPTDNSPVLAHDADDIGARSASAPRDYASVPLNEVNASSTYSNSRFDQVIDSSMASNRTSVMNSVDIARAEGISNARGLQRSVESKQSSATAPPRTSITSTTLSNGNGAGLKSQASSADAEMAPSSQTRIPMGELTRENQPDMALSAPPPPPMGVAPLDGAGARISADSLAVVRENIASTLALSPSVQSAQGTPLVITLGLQQNSLVSLAGNDMQLQVLVRAGVEFSDGDHQIFGIVSGGEYQESASDSLLAVMYDGDVYSPESLTNLGMDGRGVTGVRTTQEERNELWIGGGYRYSREIAEGWRVGVGVWSGAGEQYIRLASELPVTYQPVRWIRIEILPTVQYTTAYGETSRTTTTEFDPKLNYSERNERTTSLVRNNDLNLGIGIGASVLW